MNLWIHTKDGYKCNPEELGDMLADFETRLLFLENSLPNKIPYEETFTQSPDSTTLKEEPWSKEQWTIVNQLRAMVRFLYSKETERRANASKRGHHKDNI